MKNGYYQLPIDRDSIHFLAPWEGVARREATLLQVGTLVRTVGMLLTSHSEEVLEDGMCRPGHNSIPYTAYLTL